MNEAGLAACTQATQLLEARDEDNLLFKPLIKAMTEAESAPKTSTRMSTVEQKKMLKEFNVQVIKKETLGKQELSMLKHMLSMIPEEAQMKVFGNKILPMQSFHLEMAEHRG